MRTLTFVAWSFAAVLATAAPLAFSADPPANPFVVEWSAAQKTLRDQATLRGLMVSSGADGRPHGKVVEIIAVAPKNLGNKIMPIIRLVGDINPEMQISLQEAVRVVKLREANIGKVNIEISFDEKYSAKSGGSAGAAFAALLLASLNTFEPAEDAALTGDITVDGKVRAIGAVGPKLEGAAQGHLRALALPKANAAQLDDAVLLAGPKLVWNIQALSVVTLDDALAILRKDRSAQLTEAMALFDGLAKTMADHPVTDLEKDSKARETLAKILTLAPNHLSAITLQKFAAGKGPRVLSLNASIQEAALSLGRLRSLLATTYLTNDAAMADAPGLAATRAQVAKLRELGDPAIKGVLSAIEDYCTSCDQALELKAHPDARRMRDNMEACCTKRVAIRDAILKLIDDRETFDRLMRE